jgi:hypothetical protein
MSKMSRKLKGAISWYYPNSKRPFEYSTVATAEFIKILYDTCKDLRLVYKNINYDIEAKRIIEKFIEKGIYFINIQ